MLIANTMDTYMYLTSLLQRIQHLKRKKEDIETNLARLHDKLRRYTSGMNQRKADAQIALADPSHPMNSANVWLLKRMYDDMYSIRDLHDDISQECMKRDVAATKLEAIRLEMSQKLPQWMHILQHVPQDPKNHIYPLEVAHRCHNVLQALQPAPPPQKSISPPTLNNNNFHMQPHTNVGMNSFTGISIGMSQM